MLALTAASLLFWSPSSHALFQPDPPQPPSPDEIIITFSAGAAAFSNGVYNSSIKDNVIVDHQAVRAATLENSIWNNIGIVQFNQDVGIASNQANLISIAIATGTNPIVGAAFYGETILANNSITVGNVTRTNTISNILNNSAGIVQINQNTGTANVNLNYFGLALGLGNGTSSVTVGDSSLSRVATNNTITLDGPVNQTNVISGLYNFSGIGQINQTNGEGNVAANVMTINITVMNLP